MNHVHHDLIVAWAKGAEIQFWNDLKYRWENSSTPPWTVSSRYRIKPEPKPDVALYAMVIQENNYRTVARIKPVNADVSKRHTDTCMFIFDGETGKLKDAQVLVNSGLAV